MSEFMTLQEAIEKDIAHVGDYFLTVAPRASYVLVRKNQTGHDADQFFETKAGTRKIWRLEEDFKMWGEPTKEKLTLEGEIGYISGISIMDWLAYKLNQLPNIFDKVQSCSFPKKEYEFSDVPEVVQEERSNHSNPDDRGFCHWVASRYKEDSENNTYFRIFAVDSGYLSSYTIFCSYGMSQSWSFPIRPEAIPNPNLLLKVDGLDGSKIKPWRCLNT